MTETPRQSPTARSGTRALAVTFSVLGGGILILGGGATAVAAVSDTVRSGQVEDGAVSLPVAGIERVKLDVDAGSASVAFGSGSEATLDYSSDSGAWIFERQGDTLVVSSPSARFNLFDWRRDQSAQLTLPDELEGVDLELDLAAGEIDAAGIFGDVTYELSAGMVEIEGSADAIAGDVSAGASVVELADVQTARFDVAAGDINAHLTGEPPSDVRIGVSAGSLELQLPDVPYDVRTNRAAGDFVSSLEESTSSDRRVDVRVTAGDVALYAG